MQSNFFRMWHSQYCSIIFTVNILLFYDYSIILRCWLKKKLSSNFSTLLALPPTSRPFVHSSRWTIYLLRSLCILPPTILSVWFLEAPLLSKFQILLIFERDVFKSILAICAIVVGIDTPSKKWRVMRR